MGSPIVLSCSLALMLGLDSLPSFLHPSTSQGSPVEPRGHSEFRDTGTSVQCFCQRGASVGRKKKATPREEHLRARRGFYNATGLGRASAISEFLGSIYSTLYGPH